MGEVWPVEASCLLRDECTFLRCAGPVVQRMRIHGNPCRRLPLSLWLPSTQPTLLQSTQPPSLQHQSVRGQTLRHPCCLQHPSLLCLVSPQPVPHPPASVGATPRHSLLQQRAPLPNPRHCRLLRVTQWCQRSWISRSGAFAQMHRETESEHCVPCCADRRMSIYVCLRTEVPPPPLGR